MLLRNLGYEVLAKMRRHETRHGLYSVSGLSHFWVDAHVPVHVTSATFLSVSKCHHLKSAYSKFSTMMRIR